MAVTGSVSDMMDLEFQGHSDVNFAKGDYAKGEYGNDPIKSPTSIDQDESSRTMGIAGFSANMINCVIGAGVLNLPYSVGKVGYVSGPLLLVFGAAVSLWGLRLFTHVAVRLHEETGNNNLSFGYVAGVVHRYLPLLASFLAVLNCAIMSISYVGTAANYLTEAASQSLSAGEEGSFFTSREFFVILSLILVFPLSLPKKIGILQYTSMVAVLFVLYTTGLVIVYFFKPVEELCSTFLDQKNLTACSGSRCCVSDTSNDCCIGETNAFSSDASNYVKAFPNMATAFCCAAQIFALFNSFQKPTFKRVSGATSLAIFTTVILYLIIALFGYMTYGSNVADNLLSSYPLTTPVAVARGGIAFVLIFSYPLFLHVARDSTIDMILFCVSESRRAVLEDASSKSANILYYSVAIAYVALTVGLAWADISLSVLLNLVGSLCVANLSFTLPGIFYWFIFKDQGMTLLRVTAPLLSIFGLVIMITNIILWIVDGV